MRIAAPIVLTLLCLAQAIGAAQDTLKTPPREVLQGKVDAERRVTITGSKGPASFASIEDALATVYTRSDAAKAKEIVSDAWTKFRGGVAPAITIERLTGPLATLEASPENNGLAFTLFDGPVPLEGKSCKKISENCVICPDDKILCNVPKPVKGRGL